MVKLIKNFSSVIRGFWSNSQGTSVHPANFEINEGGERGTPSNKILKL